MKKLIVITVLNILICSRFCIAQENCSQPLGASVMGYLPSNAFTASSSTDNYGPSQGRLNNLKSAWIPQNFDRSVPTDYLQVDLGAVKTITGVSSQGLHAGNFFVKSYHLYFGDDGHIFSKFLNVNSVDHVFAGNINGNSVVTQKLPCPVTARYVRFYPKTYNVGIALRVDIVGCSSIVKLESKVRNFNVSDVKKDSINILWKQVKTDVRFFYFSYFIVDNKILYYINQFKVDPLTRSIPISYAKLIPTLQSCTEYKFILRVYNLNGCGLPEVRTVTTTTQRGKPIKPQDLIAVNKAAKTITLSWKKTALGYLCSDDITEFILYYREERDIMFETVRLKANILTYQLTDLKSWSDYIIKMASKNKLGQSDWANAYVHVEGKRPENPPVIKVAESTKPNTMHLVWENPSDLDEGVFSISIHYRQEGLGNKWMQIGFTNKNLQTEADIPRLLSWTKYEVFVLLFDFKYNMSSSTKTVFVTGKAPGAAPANLTFANVLTTTSVGLQWSALPSKYIPTGFQGYQIFYAEDKEDFKSSHISPTKDLHRVVKGLKRDTEYLFKVAAVSNSVLGPYSQEIKISTASGPLQPPVITALKSRVPNSFYIQWNVSSDVKGMNFVLFYKQQHLIDTWVKIDVGSANDYTLSKLLSWKQYDVKILVKSLGRSSESILRSVFVVGIVPGKAPAGLNMKSMNYTSIQIEWQNIDPKFVYGTLLGYVVTYEVDGDSNSAQTNFTTAKAMILSSLKPNTTYKVKVAGKTASGVGVNSSAILVSTKRIHVPEVPVVQTVESPTSRTIRITYIINGKNFRDVDFLMLQLENLRTKKLEFTEVLVSSRSEHIATSTLTVAVDPFTNYKINIKACILSICSGFSRPKVILTGEEKPTKVSNLTVTKTSDYVGISWLPPEQIPGILRYYIIDVKYDALPSPVNNYPKKVENTTLNYIFTDLRPHTPLRIIVKAATIAEGEGVEITVVSPEGKPGAPASVKVVTLQETRMMSVKWDEPDYPNGNITMYKVVYHGYKPYNPSFKHMDEIEVNKTQRLLRIFGLKPGTKYNVKVYAKTSKGYGSPSPDILIITKVKAPVEPAPPISYPSEVTSNTITVQLKPAPQENGKIDSYDIIIEILEGDNANKVERRTRKQIVQLPAKINDYETAIKNNENFYITANLDGNKLQSSAKFVVGDGGMYGGYRNQPLAPETGYMLHVRAVTVKDGNTLYGPATSIVLPKTSKKAENPKGFPIPLPALIGGGAGFVLLVVIIVVVVLYLRSSRRKKKDKMDPYELGLIRIRTASETVPLVHDRPASLSGDYLVHPDHPPIAATLFPKQVAKLHRSDNNGFKAEYNQQQIGKEFSWDIAHLPENAPKNRYANIVAYDHSRVLLSSIDGLPNSDYINASYIDGYKKPNAYISTQGPLPATFNDFWRMVWEVRSTAIVMLTNLQEKNKLKCHKYWPDDCTEYGDIIVTLVRNEPFADYTIRTFKLELAGQQKNSGEIREVRQFHFTGWPDHGVPLYPTTILNFRKKVRLDTIPDEGPAIVHCSAGVGRTGAYIVIDNMLDRIQLNNDVDIFNTIAVMRRRRIAMVQTEEQYIFVHDAIVEYLLTGETQVPLQELRQTIRKLDQIEPDSKVSGFEKQWKTLNHASPILPKSEFHSALQPENIHKNRYSTALPADVNRVLLLPMDDKESTTYINAVYVDSYRQRNAFILTQSPLPKTVIDFWRMVSEHGTTSVIMLNAVDEGDDYAKFWPDSGVRDYEMISVEALPASKKDDMSTNSFLKPMYRTPPTELVVRNFQVTDTRNPNNSFQVKLFQYHGWTETRVPNSCKAIINLLTQLERWQQQSGQGPITIMCSDGIGRSGALAAIIHVLERIKVDKVFDVFQAIKKMRIQRPHVVKYMDQYKYIHFAVQEYLNAFDDYKKL